MKPDFERDGFLQHVKEKLQLQQGDGVGGVRRQRQEAVLVASGKQVLLKQPGQLLQAGSRQRQGAAAVQNHVPWKIKSGLDPRKVWKIQGKLNRTNRGF